MGRRGRRGTTRRRRGRDPRVAAVRRHDRAAAPARSSPSGASPRIRRNWATAPSVRAAQIVACIGARPAELDERYDDGGVEHPERGRHDLARHLAHHAAAAREVGRAVGHGDAADLGRAGVEPERGVGGMALGSEVDLADDRLQGSGETARRGARATTLRRRAQAVAIPGRPVPAHRSPYSAELVTCTIEIATSVTDELVEAFHRLIPQLSSSSPPPGRDELAAIVGSPALRPVRGPGRRSDRRHADARHVPHPDRAEGMDRGRGGRRRSAWPRGRRGAQPAPPSTRRGDAAPRTSA